MDCEKCKYYDSGEIMTSSGPEYEPHCSCGLDHHIDDIGYCRCSDHTKEVLKKYMDVLDDAEINLPYGEIANYNDARESSASLEKMQELERIMEDAWDECAEENRRNIKEFRRRYDPNGYAIRIYKNDQKKIRIHF